MSVFERFFATEDTENTEDSIIFNHGLALISADLVSLVFFTASITKLALRIEACLRPPGILMLSAYG